MNSENNHQMQISQDIWKRLYDAAKGLYGPRHLSHFVYANHVVCALEAINGEIFTGICIRSRSGVANLCAERVALINMIMNSDQTVVRRILTFRDTLPHGDNLCIPCGACREFMMQLSAENSAAMILTDYDKREFVRLSELIPMWWGYDKLKEI